jgi:hypothetical protein
MDLLLSHSCLTLSSILLTLLLPLLVLLPFLLTHLLRSLGLLLALLPLGVIPLLVLLLLAKPLLNHLDEVDLVEDVLLLLVLILGLAERLTEVTLLLVQRIDLILNLLPLLLQLWDRGLDFSALFLTAFDVNIDLLVLGLDLLIDGIDLLVLRVLLFLVLIDKDGSIVELKHKRFTELEELDFLDHRGFLLERMRLRLQVQFELINSCADLLIVFDSNPLLDIELRVEQRLELAPNCPVFSKQRVTGPPELLDVVAQRGNCFANSRVLELVDT